MRGGGWHGAGGVLGGLLGRQRFEAIAGTSARSLDAVSLAHGCGKTARGPPATPYPRE